MATLRIRTFPDPVLRSQAEPVTLFNAELKTLAMDMAETMYANLGVGLAAPQVGVSLRLIVLDVSPPEERGKNLVCLVNPELVEGEGELEWSEACLSLPELNVSTCRKARVKVRGQDLDGQPLEVEATELFSVALQHEMDHLEGLLLLDKLPVLKRRMAARDLKKLAADKETGPA
jgi:peptide deformylase